MKTFHKVCLKNRNWAAAKDFGCAVGSSVTLAAAGRFAFFKQTLTLLFLFLAVVATAAENPYNEAADAKLEIKQALTQAATNQTPIIIVFGANWCGDCKMLDKAMKNGASAPLLSQAFKVVKVNIGRWDKNLDIAQTYGVPLKKGIPAVVIISAKNEVLYVTREGELANARKMGDKGIYEFFKRVTADALAKK
jgi:protein disulfide-isomerase